MKCLGLGTPLGSPRNRGKTEKSQNWFYLQGYNRRNKGNRHENRTSDPSCRGPFLVGPHNSGV